MLFSIPDDLLSRCIKFQPSSTTRTLFLLPQRNPCFVDDQGKKEDEIKSYPSSWVSYDSKKPRILG